LQDSEGYKYDQIIYSGTKGSLNGQIGPGRKIRGEIAFDAPKSSYYEFILSKAFSSGQVVWKLSSVKKK